MASDMYPCLPKGSLPSDEVSLETLDQELDLAPSLLDLASPHQTKVLKWKASRSCSRSYDARYKQTKTDKFLNRNAIIKHALRKLSDSLSACHCSTSCCVNFISRVFPFLNIMRGYSVLYDFPNDLVAGLTVGIMHIPQGMAYALLSQLPPVYGLYTSFFPVLVYFIFGSSRHISVGTFAVISLMVGAVVDKGTVAWKRQDLAQVHNVTSQSMLGNMTLLEYHEERLEYIKVSYAMSVTLAVGGMQLVLGILRLGFLTTFLSDPLISGFTTGAAIHVFSSQVKSAFGVRIGRYSGPFKLIYAYQDFFSKLSQINWVTMTATVVCILVLVLVKEGINNNKDCKKTLKVPIPTELIVVIAATVIAYYVDIKQEFDVDILGHIPRGLPSVDIAMLRFAPELVGEAFAICFTAFAISFAMAKILADKHNYTVDANQELVAHGLCNVVGPVFSSFCSAASLSRSAVQEDVGGKTQVTSLVSSCLVLVVLLALGPYFRTLPNCILSAIIIVSLKGLFLQFGELGRLWKVSKIDFTVWLVVFVSTILLDVDLGLLVGIIYNLVPILLRTQRPHCLLLGHVAGTDVYVDKKTHHEARDIPGIKIFRFEAPLYFANMEYFRQMLIKETGLDPNELHHQHRHERQASATARHHEVCLAATDTWSEQPCDGHVHDNLVARKQKLQVLADDQTEEVTYAIILDGSTIQYVDSMTVRILLEIIKVYKTVDIDVYLAECKADVRVMLEKSGIYKHIHRRHVCATIHHAVMCAQRSKSISLDTLASTSTPTADDVVVVDLPEDDDAGSYL
ncbi:solute carrier family 26 member 6-like [Gigantopelta aegis]|uniref:solute carrier family 26 member 6-like n=1 Tax=Gigantopelta aegis TaxID=1735272 RepID=UPI001B88A07E|nr:solute carrier family 26 member 6-like [Gigantopelta aegis]